MENSEAEVDCLCVAIGRDLCMEIDVFRKWGFSAND